jgi:hypothetical protein
MRLARILRKDGVRYFFSAALWRLVIVVILMAFGTMPVQKVQSESKPNPKTPSESKLANPWQELDQGLALANFDAPQKSSYGDSKITIIRIDPHEYDFKVLVSSENNKERYTPRDWAQKFKLSCAINAGMYQADGYTHVGYLKNFEHTDNPSFNSYNAFLLFNPIPSNAVRSSKNVPAAPNHLPPIQILDRSCEDLKTVSASYQTVIQNLRMVGCNLRNVWSKQDKAWSIAALGIDQNGRVLFIFCRSPYPVHDFIAMLLQLPIALQRAMYLEGGPKASLYCSVKKNEVELVGGFESGLYNIGQNDIASPIPGIIGIARKVKK